MGMEYKVVVGDTVIDQFTISTQFAQKDWAPWRDFFATLTAEERRLIRVVDEYTWDQDLDIAEQFGDEDWDLFDDWELEAAPTTPPAEEAVINKYFAFMEGA